MPHPIDAAIELADLAERMVRERYRRENPSASESELDAMIDRWLRTRPGAEHGDAEGRVVYAWGSPRRRSSSPRKVLARDDRSRPQDRVDLAALLAIADDTVIADARAALRLITTRGYSRGRDLDAALDRALAELGPKGPTRRS